MPFILPAKLFKVQTSNLNSKLPDSYLIPKEQSAQREERKEVVRISRGFGGRKRKNEMEKRRRRERAEQTEHISCPPADSVICWFLRGYTKSSWETTCFLSFKTRIHSALNCFNIVSFFYLPSAKGVLRIKSLNCARCWRSGDSEMWAIRLF